MSRRELGRVEVLARVRSRDLRVVDAAALLRVSYRQAKRIHRRYATEGDAGVIHRLAGKASNNRLSEEVKTQALTAYRDRYAGFGPTFAQEKLHDLDKVDLSRESLRQLLIREGLW